MRMLCFFIPISNGCCSDYIICELVHDKRPSIPFSPETPLALVSLIDESWCKDPFVRPQFTTIAKKLALMLGGGTSNHISPSPQRKGRIQELSREGDHHVSPDMTPIDLPDGRCLFRATFCAKLVIQYADSRFCISSSPDDKWSSIDFGAPLSLTSSRGSALSAPPLDNNPGVPLSKTVSNISAQPPPSYTTGGRSEVAVGTSDPKTYNTRKDSEDKKDSSTLTRSSSMRSWFPSSTTESESDLIWGVPSPSDIDPEMMARWDERRYRLLLQHDFHPTRMFLVHFFFFFILTSLWDSCLTTLGAYTCETGRCGIPLETRRTIYHFLQLSSSLPGC